LLSFLRNSSHLKASLLLSWGQETTVTLLYCNYLFSCFFSFPLDEDGYLFYFCKAGDGVSDVQLIHDLHKSEVYSVAKELQLPESVVNAVPSADLWENQTDENELGITYAFVELYTELLIQGEEYLNNTLAGLTEETRSLFKEMQSIADRFHRIGKHKANYPLNIDIFPTLKN
jgi:NAD+ synthase (glutamine-hydrolysing)